jgi:hypothetical protein
VKGINLITLYYTDTEGQHLPVNFRVYDKSGFFPILWGSHYM